MTTPENPSAINCTKNQKPKLSLFQDGGQWCVLYGDDPQDGISGFGMTPDEAITQFSAEVIRLQEYLPDGSMLELLRDTARIRAQKNGEVQSNNDEVICPACATQFRAIPVNVQSMLKNAGYAPPFMSPDRENVPEVDGLTFAEMKANSDRYLLLRDGDWRETPLEPYIRLQLNLMWDSKIDALMNGHPLHAPHEASRTMTGSEETGYSIKYLHDLTCMHAGAPWDEPLLKALGEVLEIQDMLRETGQQPVDPATLPWKPVIDGDEAPAHSKAKPVGPANVTIDPSSLTKPADVKLCDGHRSFKITIDPDAESRAKVIASPATPSDTSDEYRAAVMAAGPFTPLPGDVMPLEDQSNIAAAMGLLTGRKYYKSAKAVGNLLTAYEELQRKLTQSREQTTAEKAIQVNASDLAARLYAVTGSALRYSRDLSIHAPPEAATLQKLHALLMVALRDLRAAYPNMASSPDEGHDLTA